MAEASGESWGMDTAAEMNNIKYMFRENSSGLLAVTAIVTVLHTLFEVLAMKSDIEFWYGRTNLKGLSTKILVFNFVSSIVIFLYMLDEKESTSLLILGPLAIGIVLEFWKLTKGFDVSLGTSFPFVKV